MAHFTRKPMSTNEENRFFERPDPEPLDPYDSLTEAEDLAADLDEGGRGMPPGLGLGSPTARQVDRHLERSVFALLTDAASSLLTPPTAFMEGVMSMSCRMTGWSLPSISPAAIRNKSP